MAPGTNVVAPPREDPDRHRRRDDVDADDGQAKCQRDAAASFKGGRMGYFNLGNFGGVGPARTPSAMMNAQRMLHQAPMMGGGGGIGAAMVGLALGNPSPFDGVKSATTPAVNSASLTPEEGVYVNLLRQQHELQAQLLRAHLTKRHHGAMEMGGGLSRQTNSATDADSSSSYCGLGVAPVNDGGRGDAPHTKGCNNSKSQCFNGRHIHRLMGKCGHRAIIHRPKDGPAHVDFVVDGKVECYQDAKPIDGGTNAALWPSRYNCEQLQCRTGDDDPTHEVKCFQAGSCSNSCDNIVQNLEPKEFELSSLSLDNNEWNAEFFNNGTGDETLLGMIGLGGDE